MNTCRNIFLGLLLSATQAWGQDATGVVPQHCVACHGNDGVATRPGVPHLNGQQDTYLIDSITRFQRGRRPTDLADHVPQTLNADQIEQIAKHYAEVKAVRPKQETDPDKVARGEVTFRNRCFDCHGDNGREADKDAPLVAAQNLDYLVKQTALFVGGKRKFGYLQDQAFKDLSEEELLSALHFFASQEQYPPAQPTGKKKRR